MFQLNMTQNFNVPIARLFEAWSNIDIIKTWFAPGNMTVPEATAEVEVGGQYRIVMQDEDGAQHIVGGQYKEISANEKLVFSWQWEGSPNTTLVTVLFKAIDEGTTELMLNHSEFIEEGFRDHHLKGWEGCLANLHKIED